MSKLMTDALVATVVLLLVAFLFLEYETQLKEAYSKAFGKTSCEASVREHAALKLGFADFSNEIKCPTVKLKINDKNEEIVKKKIADAMVDCWEEYGQGKLKLFKDDNIYCAICHRITFGKDIQVKGFTNYLAMNNPKGQKISYLQYLTTERTQNSDFLKENENQIIGDTIIASQQNEYTIIFTFIKGKQYWKEYRNKAAYIAPGVGLFALGIGVIKVGGVLAGIATSTGFGAPVGVVISVGSLSTGGFLMASGALWGYISSFIEGVPFEHIEIINFIPYDAQYLQNLNCKEIPIKQQ